MSNESCTYIKKDLSAPSCFQLVEHRTRVCGHCGKEPARTFPLPLDGISLVEEMLKLLLIPVGVAWMMLLLHPRGHHCLRAGSELQQRLSCIENRKGRKKCSA